MSNELEIFYEEAKERLGSIEEALLLLRADPQNTKIHNQLFRDLHTIKGSAAMFDVMPVADFTHKVENVIDLVRHGKKEFTTDVIEILLECHDHINNLLESPAESLSQLQVQSTEIIKKFDSPYVCWLPIYSVGIDEVDEQHKKIFAMINTLHAARNSQDISATIEKTIEDMVNYVGYHFETEKSYLQKLPQFKDHEKEHWAFTKKTLQFVKEYHSCDQKNKVLSSMLIFLSDWLKHHIQGIDIKQFQLLSTQ